MEDHIRFDAEACALLLLDQRKLPLIEETFACRTVEDVIYALQTMVVRGAPAIGVSAAYGCRIALKQAMAAGAYWRNELERLLTLLVQARPTAVNLAWAVRVMREAGVAIPDPLQLAAVWLTLAREIHTDDIAMNKAMGRFGGALLADGDTVMTHCNAGALATAGYGTALGVIRGAVDMGKKISVIANETRPFLQGARLTAYELHKDSIPVTVACDNACSLLMQRGLVSKVVVGADRIVANGDVANKIGTSGVAILARHYGIPFYVAAPSSTFDLATPEGSLIPIEDRTPLEVTHVGATQITPDGVPVFNYAFDVTDHSLITGIITERGVLSPPYTSSIAEIIGQDLKS
ncbi:MAG: S-methyl-5-thioribose-1-phosphate isomerase [Desulfomicrobium sp.]|nr:S-methyl-5-thioribose-1-phosphate isomerase [Pseudomonadota bacterium]MBV1711161.1 S-methyl-5-thioribose-1-phosphate isomerase [Desulfomicrobium sp.]MBU4569832.1 S-methyl-5-thioribose-1-phosphate isomerase [Pseudomonadota bacterium]MBU4594930.1 S-methyl-5-thioribose-1-phosphate isomerase [Pseudomonadota bacterium]MBV1718949.1 S-methyl-5-thioribose-1-phosphate isomerase [Desulfomicrobium sp.]